MAEGILQVLNSLERKRNNGIPIEIATRLERLLQPPGKHRDYAACRMARDLRWLYYVDPRWTRTHLLPMLASTHDLCEPAWNGLLEDGTLPDRKLFSLLKPHFLNCFALASDWRWNSDTPFNRLAERLIVACYWRRRTKSYVEFAEARVALRLIDDSARAHAIWFLANMASDPKVWKAFVKPFIQGAWPRESRFRTEAISRQLAFLAEQSGDNFPDVVKIIQPLLVPSEQLDITVHRAARSNNDRSLAERFPASLLTLLDQLVPDRPSTTPYDLGTTLLAMAQSLPALRDDRRWKRLFKIASAA